ncbi:hypothetical protein MD484_g248, partial [Candolleomyces efflorescens]
MLAALINSRSLPPSSPISVFFPVQVWCEREGKGSTRAAEESGCAEAGESDQGSEGGLVGRSRSQGGMFLPVAASSSAPSTNLKALEVIEGELAEQERVEEEERIRLEEERKAAAGAFPTLGHSAPSATPAQPAPTTHKVLSIGGTKAAGKKGKVTLSSFTQSPTPSQQSSRASTPRPPEIVRVPPPPADRTPVLVAPRDRSRPFKNLVQPGASGFYVPAEEGDGKKEGGGRRRRKGKGGGEKGKEKENEGSVQGGGEARGT